MLYNIRNNLVYFVILNISFSISAMAEKPYHHVYENGKWRKRVKPYEPGVNKLEKIDRMYSVTPNQGARYCHNQITTFKT